MDRTQKYRNGAGTTLDEAEGKPVVQIRNRDAASCNGVRLESSEQANGPSPEIERRRCRIRPGGAEPVPVAFVSPGRCTRRADRESRMTRAELAVRSRINRQRA